MGRKYEIMNKQLGFTKMPFGKHAGEIIANMPLIYLDWLVGQKDFAEKNSQFYRNVKEYLGDPAIMELLDEEIRKEDPR